MWEETEGDRQTSAPGVVQVGSRATGQYPEYYRRQRQTGAEQSQPSPPQPLRERSIITMRHVRQHLPVVEGELMDEEESHEILQQATVRENTETTEELSDRSMNSSVESLNTTGSNHILNAKTFLRNKFGKVMKKKFSPLRRSKKLKETDVLFGRDMMSPPLEARCETVGDMQHVSDVRRPQGGRTRRDLRLSSASIPEEVIFDPTEEDEDPPLEAASTQDEIEQEDDVVDQILDVCPEADRRDTHRSIREGQSVRHILGEIVRNSLEPVAAPDVDIMEETERMVKQVQEAFPDVNVDRSYALLRNKSLQTVMCQLAEESLSNSGDFQYSENYLSNSELAAIQMIQDAFPQVEKAEARGMLRSASVSSVMMQLATQAVSETPVPVDDLDRSEQGSLHQSHESLIDHILDAFPDVTDFEAEQLLRERSVTEVMEALANQTSEEFRITQSNSD